MRDPSASQSFTAPEEVLSPGPAFDKLATRYDDEWTQTLIGKLQREAVWRNLDRLFQPGDRVLELGCGTGADAAYLARRGIEVRATDISPRMTQATCRRAEQEGLVARVSTQTIAIEDLARLEADSFDGALSNFGALNCVDDLRPVAEALARFVRPGGRIALCVMGRFCLWETIWYLLRARPGKAFRRLRGRAQASLGTGQRFAVYYPSLAQLQNAFSSGFRLQEVRGVGILVPPSYAEGFAKRFPRLMRMFARIDRAVERRADFRAIADHRLLVFVRR